MSRSMRDKWLMISDSMCTSPMKHILTLHQWYKGLYCMSWGIVTTQKIFKNMVTRLVSNYILLLGSIGTKGPIDYNFIMMKRYTQNIPSGRLNYHMSELTSLKAI